MKRRLHKWTQDSNPGGFEVLRIPGNDRQIMDVCSCGEQAIGDWQIGGCRNQSPFLRDSIANRQNGLIEFDSDTIKPALKCRALRRRFLSQQLNALPDFPQRKRANPVTGTSCADRPADHAGVGLTAFAQFGEDIGVEEPGHQNSTLRASFLRRLRVISNSTSGCTTPSSDSRNCIRVGLRAGELFNASLRMFRCSSSADTPRAAARFFNFRTSASSRFLTSNCGMAQSAITAFTCQAPHFNEVRHA